MQMKTHKTNAGASDANIYRVSQPGPNQQEKKGATQQEAKSAYSFRDSRHVVKGGIAAVSFDLAVAEENAEHIELLGFQAGDSLRLDGKGGVDGLAFIQELTKDSLVVQIQLTIAQGSQRAALGVFERMFKHPCKWDQHGQVSFTACITIDRKGGFTYSIADQNNRECLLMADALDLRIDNFGAGNALHQVLTFIVASGNTISFAIEHEPAQDPKGKLKVSLAPGLGEFDVSRQASR